MLLVRACCFLKSFIHSQVIIQQCDFDCSSQVRTARLALVTHIRRSRTFHPPFLQDLCEFFPPWTEGVTGGLALKGLGASLIKGQLVLVVVVGPTLACLRMAGSRPALGAVQRT